MDLKLLNIKWVIGSIYLLLLIAGITFLLSKYNISDFFSYEFIRLNKNVILEYRRENFLILTILFFILPNSNNSIPSSDNVCCNG